MAAIFRFKPVVERTDHTTWHGGVTRLTLDPAVLEEAREKWFPCFPTRYEPLVTWSAPPTEGQRVGKVELLHVDPSGRVDVHAALAHESVPEDIVEAAVLLGCAMSFIENAQPTPVPDLYARPETATWFDEVMAVCPQAEFLEKFFSGFWRWARVAGLVKIPARVAGEIEMTVT